ncbi:MAG: alpha/beta fold hydrolase, partial [Bradymonadaceae bacterium]
GCPYHFVDWIPAVLGAADAMGWTDFTLLGHSMGAAIGSLLGSVAGPRLERMVWIDALGVWTHPDDQAPTQLARSLREREILGEKSPRRMIDLEQAISVLGSAYADLSPESLEILLGRGLRQTEEGVEFRYDLQLRAASPMRLTEAQMIAFMNAITCPVFLVRPRQGWPSDEDTMKRRLEAVPDIRLMEIDGGHHAHLEYPERMADEIGKFLRGR